MTASRSADNICPETVVLQHGCCSNRAILRVLLRAGAATSRSAIDDGSLGAEGVTTHAVALAVVQTPGPLALTHCRSGWCVDDWRCNEPTLHALPLHTLNIDVHRHASANDVYINRHITPAQVAVLGHKRASHKWLLLCEMDNFGCCPAERLVAQCHWLKAVVLNWQQPAVKFEVPVQKVLWCVCSRQMTFDSSSPQGMLFGVACHYEAHSHNTDHLAHRSPRSQITSLTDHTSHRSHLSHITSLTHHMSQPKPVLLSYLLSVSILVLQQPVAHEQRAHVLGDGWARAQQHDTALQVTQGPVPVYICTYKIVYTNMYTPICPLSYVHTHKYRC